VSSLSWCPRMGSLKSPCRTSYWSSIETIALSCLFRKPSFVNAFQTTDKRANTRADKQKNIAIAYTWCGGGLITRSLPVAVIHNKSTKTATKEIPTSSSAVAERPRDASCLSVVGFVASIVQYLERSFFISYFSFGFTSAYTIQFCSVVFGVTSSLAVIHTIDRDCV